MTRLVFAFVALALLAPLLAAVSDRPTFAAEPFDLAQVRLGPGPFREAQERDREYLLRLEPDRLLHTFRLNVGLPSSAEPYGGWEGPDVELRGHSLGHYLSACSLMVRSTGDQELKKRVDTIVAELAKCQAASPKAGFHEGYLSAFPESFIDRVEARKEVWAPWYTLHKILAGLIDAYTLTDNKQALDVARNMAKWIAFRVDHLTTAQMQESLQTEHGGMVEALANLYAITGDPEHRRLAHAFDHEFVFEPLAEGRDVLDGLHANTQIPKIIGAAREYELTSDPRYRKIAETFWDRVALHRSYVIGGHSDSEHFFPVDQFAAHVGTETAETCNTYNMLKLTRHLYSWDAQEHWIEFYERGLYNHILASQDPAQGMFVYLMSLEPGHFKTYSTPENSFWCCVGTGMENHAKYADTIFAHDAEGLFVNLFIPAELNWSERGVSVRQETRFPDDATTRLTISGPKASSFALRIRHPQWSAGPLGLKVNGETVVDSSAAGSYAVIKREWHAGDRVEVTLSPVLHTEALPGDATEQAILFGPIVLAGKLGAADMPSPYERDQLDLARFPHPDVPAFIPDGADWLGRVERISPHELLFRTHGIGRPHDVLLAPFYQLQHERYVVYWDVLTPTAWDARNHELAALDAEWKALPATAVDFVAAGDLESEARHAIRTGKTDSGQVDGRTWREAQKGESIAYTLATQGQEKLTLVCAYGARDRARKFDLWVDDTRLATPKLTGENAGEIVFEKYEIPANLLTGKKSVTVKFQSDKNWDGVTANIFACALVRP
ncbi:MAG TPA: beta-L-arabinofuranosidase domain-containing protein [Candidatus Didemnitutus sp.]|nr:beta-L-arabinofuranosidase domain-containing protein [Candidatus Didemnitutus sp.]